MKLKFWKKEGLTKGDTYTVETGDYAGQILTFIESDEESHHFVSMPEAKNLAIPLEKFDFAKEHEIIKYIEKVPRKVTRVVEAQFRHNQGKRP